MDMTPTSPAAPAAPSTAGPDGTSALSAATMVMVIPPSYHHRHVTVVGRPDALISYLPGSNGLVLDIANAELNRYVPRPGHRELLARLGPVVRLVPL
ncbi:hypothetical protein L228DRAFT_267487 [Xylona heveae TC161]|uniref:Uncharacterized protein n=1 Tax=Xylona heveae (strain CBS 132557 / TC161) TaxID=1328760 RepID=A0A161TCH9_XYLHT|nr:hypothetical protein L228DRAFT_267487 [Xylona heveae TC161]KZF23487.1 hypothetical protein L228DRAFT_267487 [Xylona heveae TC161]